MSALLTVDEAATALKVSSRTVRRKCMAGQIEYQRVAGRRGGQSGSVYVIPESSIHRITSPSTTDKRSVVHEPISIGTFRARGGTEAVKAVGVRRDLIEAARAITGPNRTEHLKALAREAGIHVATLYRWMDLKSEGSSSMQRAAVTFRPKFDENGMRRRISIEPAARAFFHKVYLQQKKLPISSVIEDHYKPEAMKHGWSIPSRATFYRLIEQDLSVFETSMGREGINKTRSSLAPKNTLKAPTHRHKTWIADTRTLDFWVQHPTKPGVAVRPRLAAFVDWASRLLVGDALTLTPNTDAVRRAFTKAVYPNKPLQAGLPEWVLIDNGSEFINEVVTNMLTDVGVKVHKAEVGSGWSKGVIESFFKFVSWRFDRQSNSWTGNNPLNRPEGLDERRMAAEEKLLTWAELELVWAQFVTKYNTEHRHTGNGMDGKTAIERYLELPSASIGVPSSKALALMFVKEERRKVAPQGIKLRNVFMFHPDLYAFSNRINRSLAGEWVTLRFDPEDTSLAHVFYEGEYVCTIGEKVMPTWDPEDEENMAKAGQIHTLRRQMEREALERLHKRPGDMTPWIPPLDAKVQPGKAEPEVAGAPRMVTKLDRATKQIEQQRQKGSAKRKRNDQASPLFQQLGKDLLA